MSPAAEQIEQWTWYVRRKGSTAKPLTVVHATYQGARQLGCRVLVTGDELCPLHDVECRAVNLTDIERQATAAKAKAA